MTTSELTADEQRAIRALRRAAKIWPDSLRLYAVDTSIFVAKVGVPVNELYEDIDIPIECGAVATDMHDYR